MTPEEILNSHIKLCDQAYEVLLEENNALRIERKEPSEAILTKKRDLMPELDASIGNIKLMRNNPAIKEISNQELIQKAQQKLMKIFYLIRENEQFLLKNVAKKNMHSVETPKPFSMNELQSIYKKNT